MTPAESELKSKGVKFIRPLFVDILGRTLDFAVPIEELSAIIREGKGFDGSSVEGFARIEESDLRFYPQIETLKILPWECRNAFKKWKEAVVFGWIMDPEGNHFEGDTRKLLRDVVEKYKDIGELKCGVELEFFLFKAGREPIHTDASGYFQSGSFSEIRREAQLILHEMGIKTEMDHHEGAASQHEIDLSYTDALSASDNIVLAKFILKKIAKNHGLYASFMPKPIYGINGNGMHLHLSLWKGNQNLFYDRQKEGLSDLALSYIAGLIKYGKEIQAGLNQWINSYKRLQPGYEAPVYLVWARRNRSAYIRIPEYQKGSATRIELRSPDPACNPYLALALIHAAGIKGIEEELEPPEPIEKDVFKMSEEKREKQGIERLSPSLEEALWHFKRSKLVRHTLTNHIFEKFVENKEIECKEFNATITNWEIERYFPML